MRRPVAVLIAGLCIASFVPIFADAQSAAPRATEEKEPPRAQSAATRELDRRLSMLETQIDSGLDEIEQTIRRLEKAGDQDGLQQARQFRARLLAQRELSRQFAADLPFVTLYYTDGLYGYRPAAYDGWVVQPGQGIVNKWSFLPR